MKKVAIIGIQGVPANYGGFETLVENLIGKHHSTNIEYTVFCSSKDMPSKPKEHKGAKLKYIPLHANGLQSILYDIVAMTRSIRGYDALLILGVSGCIFLPVVKLLSKGKIIVNIDGLEHRRDKWSRIARKFLLLSEVFAVKYAHTIITDNKGISEYVKWRYRRKTKLITYGGDHVTKVSALEREQEVLNQYGLKKGEYIMSLCRIEPENNCHITLEAVEKTNQQLVFVGNWNRNEYSRKLKEKYKDNSNIVLLESIYDLEILHILRSNARCYIHGHSAGGTNPSLVEAMFFGRPILAYDVIYNRETTHGKALYYSNSQELIEYLKQDSLPCDDLRKVADRRYTWKSIIREYEQLY